MNFFSQILNPAFGAVVEKEQKESGRLILGDPSRLAESYTLAATLNPNGFRKPSFKAGNTRKFKRMGRGLVGGNEVKRDFQANWTGSERGRKRRELRRKAIVAAMEREAE